MDVLESLNIEEIKGVEKKPGVWIFIIAISPLLQIGSSTFLCVRQKQKPSDHKVFNQIQHIFNIIGCGTAPYNIILIKPYYQ